MDLKTLGQELVALKPIRTGRPPSKQGDLKEMEQIKAFFAKRDIPRSRVAKQIGVSFTSVCRWWEGNVTENRLEQLKELVEKIETVEKMAGKPFGS